MPIRFRCAYCNQLMAISTRKAGTVVSCPKCAGDIIVPPLPGTAPNLENADQPVNQAFDDPEFDAHLNQPDNLAPTMRAPAEAEAKPVNKSSSESSPPFPSIQRRGVFISFRWLFIGICLEILLVILVFIVGLIVGWKAPPPP